MSDFTGNGYAREQRMRKATAIADEVWTGERWQGAELWPAPDRGEEPVLTHTAPTRLPGPPPSVDPDMRKLRRQIERAAGVRPCSEQTWQLVRDLLDQRHADAEAQRRVDRELRW